MPSDKRILITAKATGLMFSLFDVASTREVPFQTIIDIAGACSTISDVLCVGSPVIIIIYKNVNKQVHRKIWNFQLE